MPVSQPFLLFSDVCCVQEHFLLDAKDKKNSNTDKLKTVLGPAYDMHIVPAVKTNTSISRGRESGGLATIWKKALTKYVNVTILDFWELNFVFPSLIFS